MDIEDSVIVITGASMGIGRATALALAKRGARLALAARSRDRLDRLAAELRSIGADVLALPTDIAGESAPATMVKAAHDHFDRIDVLINNAGVVGMCPLERMPAEPFQQMLEVNLFGPLRAMQAVVPLMRAQGGGLIVNISSMVSRAIWKSMGAYAATKYGLNCLSETLRIEVAPDNIRVVSVFPGATTSDLANNALLMIEPPTETPDGRPYTADTPEFVAEKICAAIVLEPHEQYMGSTR